MNQTTNSYQKLSNVTIETLTQAIKELPPISKNQSVVLNKKDFKALKKVFDGTNKKVGSLYGIKVYMKPGLKKARVFSEI